MRRGSAWRNFLASALLVALVGCVNQSGSDEVAPENNTAPPPAPTPAPTPTPTPTPTPPPANQAPTAHAGPDRTTPLNTAVALDGSASGDPNGDALSFSWAWQSRPGGSQAALIVNGATPAQAQFTPDLAGAYVARLTVSDGSLSATDTVTITAIVGRVLRVGPTRAYAKPSAAAAAAIDGDVIEIDAGTYPNDAAVWRANNLTIRAVGGRAHLQSNGAAVEGKGIWVIKGANTTVENIEFSGATVPHRNGAGIRQEGPTLTIRNCYFHDNENGILTGGHSTSDILIEYSEFARNGYGDGQSHNMYIGNIRNFTLQHSYSHHAKIGHNVKTRAQVNYILYNRIMDEVSGTASYQIDFSNGGTAFIIGNLLQQGSQNDNRNIIAYAQEGLSNSGRDLYIVNNTIVNDDPAGGSMVALGGGPTTTFKNNLIIDVPNRPSLDASNYVGISSDVVDRAGFDYRPSPGSGAINKGVNPGSSPQGYNLAPVYQYVYDATRESRPSNGVIDAGAFER